MMSTDAQWVDDLLLARSDGTLLLDRPMTRAVLREAVEARQQELRDLGIGSESSVAIRVPACAEFVTTALATWRCGARLILVDHRVPDVYWERILGEYHPDIGVTSSDEAYPDGRLGTRLTQLPGRPPATEHALIQFSSGSTGIFKGIGRSVEDIVAEVEKTASVDHAPKNGEKVVLLTAFSHAYGLFAGLLNSLRTGADLIVRGEGTAFAVFRTIQECRGPTTVLGVPFHLRMLSTVIDPPSLTHFERFISSGEVAPADLCDAVADRYGTRVGQIYGMTETGMIAADLGGRLRPAVGVLAPGVEARTRQGELLVRLSASPYVNGADQLRGGWRKGWFHTGDAASIDDENRVRLDGRLDSQIAVGGLKVDLMAVEDILAAIEGVRDIVVVHHNAIHAYLVLDTPDVLNHVRDAANRLLAPHQRPAAYHVVPALPATPTGKRIRDPEQLSAAATVSSARVAR
ncbi:class I adenylate-forming enzyme family protein [Amycolatopsis sp. NPDC049868]|uniref:class I adenylate-forming enzyme family protein n=1 Tax=Amycolatopsis sp. NPDC049868 TaxID=3363934 RepID=UPI0037AE825C